MNNKYFTKLYQRGRETAKGKKVVFCGMVRDCGKEVRHIIPTIEKLGNCFADYQVVIFENNSKDKTKEILLTWQDKNNKVKAICNDFDESSYNDIPKEDCYYLPNSRRRIQKYVDYRNLYMEYLDKEDIKADYVIIVDFDVAKIDIPGVLTSFGSILEWDVITANGFSLSPKLKRRYHDTYALCEYGHENIPQTIPEIIAYRDIFAPLRKGMPFIRVYSAYGGLAIYKRDILRGKRYRIINNDFEGVEVHCEHFSLFKALADSGFDKVYINPNMEVYYQRLSLSLFIKKTKDLLYGYK